MGELAKKQYNPTAPDWALGPSAEVPEFLPQPQSHNVTPSLVSTAYSFSSSQFMLFQPFHPGGRAVHG